MVVPICDAIGTCMQFWDLYVLPLTLYETVAHFELRNFSFYGFIVLKEIIVPTVCAVLFPFKKN